MECFIALQHKFDFFMALVLLPLLLYLLPVRFTIYIGFSGSVMQQCDDDMSGWLVGKTLALAMLKNKKR